MKTALKLEKVSSTYYQGSVDASLFVAVRDMFGAWQFVVKDARSGTTVAKFSDREFRKGLVRLLDFAGLPQ